MTSLNQKLPIQFILFINTNLISKVQDQLFVFNDLKNKSTERTNLFKK